MKNRIAKNRTATSVLFSKVNCGYDRWNNSDNQTAGAGQLPEGVKMTDEPDFVAGKSFAEFGAEGKLVSPGLFGNVSVVIVRNYYSQPEKVVALDE